MLETTPIVDVHHTPLAHKMSPPVSVPASASIPFVDSTASPAAPKSPSTVCIVICPRQLLWLITVHLEIATFERCFPRRSDIHGTADYCWYCKHHSIWLNLCNDSSILCQIHLHENEQLRSQILVSIDINSNSLFFFWILLCPKAEKCQNQNPKNKIKN